jgi:hypothetical protein
MEEKKDKKIYLRIIASEGKKALLEAFVKRVDEKKKFLKNKIIKECFVSSEQAELWADEFITQDTSSSCGLMQGFFGDKVYFEQLIDFFKKKECGFHVMYHDKEHSYERIGLADDLLFLGGFAYMQDCENKRDIRDRLKDFRELPFFEEELGAYFTDSESNQGKQEHEEKVLSGCSAIKEDEYVSDAATQVAAISALSNRSLQGIKKNKRVVLPEDLLSVSSQSSSISSCSSRRTARYTDHAPSPLCIPVCSMKSEKIVKVIEKSE